MTVTIGTSIFLIGFALITLRVVYKGKNFLKK